MSEPEELKEEPQEAQEGGDDENPDPSLKACKLLSLVVYQRILPDEDNEDFKAEGISKLLTCRPRERP